MDFKRLFLIPILAQALIACESYTPLDEENKVGEPLKSISDLNTPYASARDIITTFDDTTRKIHQFDLDKMKLMRTLEVKNPKEDHYLLYDHNGNYVVDLTKKHLSIYDKDSKAIHNPLRFLGKPISAAFRPQNGLLVVYDDLMTIGLLKLDENGKVLKSWVSGGLVDQDTNGDVDGDDDRPDPSNYSIVSGDLDFNGNLVLALRDGTITIVDVEKSLDEKKWNYQSFSIGGKVINWLAPLREDKDRFIYKSNTQVGIINLKTKEIESSERVYNSHIRKLSRTVDPHIIVEDQQERLTYYAKITKQTNKDGSEKVSSKLLSRSQFNTKNKVALISHLDLQTDTWLVVNSTEQNYEYYSFGHNNTYYRYNDINQDKGKRRVVKFRFSDGLPLLDSNLPENATLTLSQTYAFALFPSELGYAKRIELESGKETIIKQFNLDHIKRKP